MRFKQAYLWIGVSLVLLCLWLFFFCMPMASRIEETKSELAEVEVRIARVEAQIAQPGKVGPERLGKGYGKSPADQIPQLDAFPEFMKKVASSIRSGGVTIDRLNGRIDEGGAKTGSALAYPVTEIDFTGQFVDIGRALEQVQTVKAFRRILRVQMVSAESMYPDLKGSVEIEFKALRN
jgi:hypothetical protein